MQSVPVQLLSFPACGTVQGEVWSHQDKQLGLQQQPNVKKVFKMIKLVIIFNGCGESYCLLVCSYFTATLPHSPGERQLFSVGEEGREDPHCITCTITDSCLYTQSLISHSGQAFVQVRILLRRSEIIVVILALPWSYNTIQYCQVFTR